MTKLNKIVLIWVIFLAGVLPILKSCAQYRQNTSAVIGTSLNSSQEILLASEAFAALSQSRFNAVAQELDAIADAFFFDRSGRDTWLSSVAIFTSINQNTLNLSFPTKLEQSLPMICARETAKPQTKPQSKKAIKPIAHASAKKVAASADEIFIKSKAAYLAKAAQLGCFMSLIHEARMASNTVNPNNIMTGDDLEANLSAALAASKKVGKYLLGKDLVRRDYILYAAKFSVEAASLLSSSGSVKMAPDAFYADDKVFEYFKSKFKLSNVMALAYVRASVSAASAHGFSPQEYADWVEAALSINALGVKTYGSANLPVAMSSQGFASKCGLKNMAASEIGQLTGGLSLSACAWKSALLQHGTSAGAYVAYVASSNSLVVKSTQSVEIARRNYVLSESKEFGLVQPKDITLANSKSSDYDRIMMLINIVSAPLKEEQKHRTAEMVESVAKTVFKTDADRRDWYIVLAIESKFVNGLTSPTGAVGYGQLIPSYYADFGKRCGLFDTKKSDIYEAQANLLLSACYLKALRENQPFISQALVAYNAGPHSKDLKAYNNLGTIGLEPANYVSRYQLIRERLDESEKPYTLTENIANDGAPKM